MNQKIIYHLSMIDWWDSQMSKLIYFSPTFEQEKFIHASTFAQLNATINRYYKKETDMVLLHIDTEKLEAKLLYELSPSIQEEFPHVFGGINMDAIIKIEFLNKKTEDDWEIIF